MAAANICYLLHLLTSGGGEAQIGNRIGVKLGTELEKNWEQKLDDEEKFETWIRNRNCIYKLETEIGGRKYWKKKV